MTISDLIYYFWFQDYAMFPMECFLLKKDNHILVYGSIIIYTINQDILMEETFRSII